MASLLTNIIIRSIGIVDKGASGDQKHRPRILLYKRVSIINTHQACSWGLGLPMWMRQYPQAT